jgi:sugar O-acyltransferase (sialic acid O-acetyltransferase NeuD family)
MKIAIIGAGGFAREVEWLIKDIQRERSMSEISEPLEFAGFLISDLSRRGEHDSEVLGDFSWLRTNRVDALAIGIGTPEVRLRLGAELKRDFPQIHWPALIHPSVMHDDSCAFGEGSIVCAGNILTVNVRVERLALINLNCTVGHEAVIGAGTVISPSCSISGGAKIGEGAFLGSGVVIGQYLSIGDRAVVGAAACVLKSVPPDISVYGVPARPKEEKIRIPIPLSLTRELQP